MQRYVNCGENVLEIKRIVCFEYCVRLTVYLLVTVDY